jgi:CheY-like chemotaxis protein
VKTILVLEDDLINIEFFRAFLELSGYSVLTATNAEEALSLSENAEETVDLLLADVFLRGSSGIQVARLISTAHPGLSVLFMSGYPLETIRNPESTLILGQVSFLQKPFMPAALLAKIGEMVGSE